MSTKATKKSTSRKKPGGQVNTDFSIQEVLDDYSAAYSMVDSRKLDMYSGQNVAVYQGKVVGAGDDAAELRQQVSRELKIHPERLAVIHMMDEMII